MRLDQSFTVPVPVEEAWRVLLDLPRIAPCMPGATITGVDGDAFTGTVKVKLGPITLTYQGQGRFVERDEAARRVVVEARGKDVRAAGTAAATVTAVLADAGGTTTVDVSTDLTVTGRPAQFGRGMISEVSGKLLGQFAECLADTLGRTEPAPEPAPEPAATVDAPVPTVGAEPAAEPAAEPRAEPRAEPAAEPAATVVPPVPAVGAEPVPAQPAPQREAEPVDLLRLAGSTSAARRAVVGGVGAVVALALIWLIIRWLRD